MINRTGKNYTALTLICRTSLLLAAALAVFLLPGGLQNAEASSERTIRDRKFIFVGDSYAIKRSGIDMPWPEVFQEVLGIKKEQVLYARRGGYGFAKYKHRFVDLIRELKKDKAVTDIIVLGGIGNDWRYPLPKIRDSMYEFNKECRKRFPNARIVYGYCNWNISNIDVQDAILYHGPYYKKYAEKCGWVYLSGMETMLRTHPSYFQDDDHHPTQRTQFIIGEKAAALYSAYIVRKIRLNKTELELKGTKSETIVAKIYPPTAQRKKVLWSSSNERVATVTGGGRVSPIGNGTTVIRAKTEDGGLLATCKVRVVSGFASQVIDVMPDYYITLGG